jgi:hypothetical protein
MKKYPTVHVGEETHAILMRVCEKTGMKIRPLIDRIVQGWDQGDVFFLGQALHGAMHATRKAKTGPAVRAVKCGPAAEQGAPAALPGKAPETSEREWSATAAGVQAAGGVRSAAESAGSTGAPPVPSSRALAGAATATRPAGVGANGAAGRRMTDEG